MVKEHGEGRGHLSPLSRSPRLQVFGGDTPVLAVTGRRIGRRGDESPPEPDEEIRRLASMITRQASRGFTGETWYDFDLPLNRTDPIVILHFNDVYNIDTREDGSGGVARFVTAMQRFSHLHPLVFFSGDALNPSLMSTYMKGRQMVPFLNLLKVHTACLGNHDFDFGIDELEYTIGSCNFPWLLTNVFERSSSDDQRKLDRYMHGRGDAVPPSGGCAEEGNLAKHGTSDDESHAFGRVPADPDAGDYTVLPGEPIANAWKYRLFEWQGVRIGVIGLVEREWLDTLACINADDVVYVDYVVAANRMCRFLRAKECELIIALTHMRAPNDQRLAEMAPDIDIILGGHDHDYYGLQVIGGTPVVKSGTDFYDFTAIAIFPGDSSPQPNLLATALIDDSGKHMGAAAIAAAAVASAPRVLDGTDSPAEAAASAIAAAVAVAEEASNNQAEELSPSELASQLLHAKGKIVPDNRQGQGGTEERPLLLKPALPAQSQKQLKPSDCPGGSVVIPKILGKSLVQWERVRVTPNNFAKNKHVELLVKKYERHIKQQMRRKLAKLGAELETRFRIIRTQESNCGNWLCELMRKECKSDIAFINSGTIRSDCVFKEGDFRYGDLAAMLPMADEIAVVSCKGSVLLAALENAVSQVPKTEGRFLQVAGIRFEFDSSKPAGSRVIRETVQVAPRGSNLQSSDGQPSLGRFEPLDENAEYTVATKSYVLQGRDGFTMMTSCPVVVEGERLPPLPTLVRNALALTAMANGLKKPHSRVVSRQLSCFTSLQEDQMLSEFGCKRDMDDEVVLAPKCDGRIVDRNRQHM
ncbi:nucleotidase, putative [Eimeria acervulina]|uniref:Nucleotidase, putative n=1 Tax=Eimeria acervulina TaxID=5801 RepID=U6GDG1_EIMAC|nr:nucleotidase, putative [Eimeria acervulina]CDI78306.1 nucleotidase, putative [Eimeria acervulina]